MNKRLGVLFVFVFLAFASAEEWYVRDGASGNGADWENAFDSLPSVLNRGDTYYVADGLYGAYNFNDPSSGSQYITIKKATAFDHGTDLGWQDSYGDGQAEWTKWDIDGSYYILDGQVGGGPDSWRSGHGFKLYEPNCPESTQCGSKKHFVEINNVPVSYVNISHLEVSGCGTRRISNGYEVRDEHFYASRENDHVTISHVWSHDTSGLHGLWLYPSYFTVEYSYFEKQRYESGGECSIHGEMWNFFNGGADTNTHIRWNIFQDGFGTGGICFQDTNQGGFEVYGNVFYFTRFDGEYEYHTATIYAGTEPHNNMLVYGNTFVDLDSPGLQNSRITFTSGENNFARNNLWVNSDNPGLGGSVAGSNNILDGDSSLFVDYDNDDFRLARATEPGYLLEYPYNVDMYGNVRGEDGAWDIGAYEYVSSSPPVSSERDYFIVDHTSAQQFDNIPTSWIEAAKENLHIAYQHTSHGSQIISGMNAIENYEPYGGLYEWSDNGATGLDLDDYGIPGASDLGYENDWPVATRNFLDNPANSHVNVVLWSWCDIAGHDIEKYLADMDSLIEEYPDVQFVYITGHANGGGEGDSSDAQNELIRQHVLENGGILFDFADFENYDPDNNYYLDKNVEDDLVYDDAGINDGNWASEYISRHPGSDHANLLNYISSCAHSPETGGNTDSELNCILKGQGAWYLFALLAGWDGNLGPCVDLDNDGVCASLDCNDSSGNVYPGAVEVCGNGVDEDCNGVDLACGVEVSFNDLVGYVEDWKVGRIDFGELIGYVNSWLG